MSANTLPTTGPESAPPPALDSLLALTAPGMACVNAVIRERMASDIPLIPELADHLISSGGKRMRPMLTVASAMLVGFAGDAQYKLAAAVEFIHTATLLHDDVVDGSDQRRGKAAANIVFGNPATVLVGDFLFSRSFELMVEARSLDVLQILANASAVIAEGEVDQLTAQRVVETTEAHYLSIISAKTAALFAAACRIAAVAAGRGPAEEAALDAYGRYLGVAFQLADDAIDYASQSAEMGKDQGDDFRDGKMTLPVILAYADGDAEERRFWQDAIAGFANGDAELARAVAIINRHGAVERTLARARDYAEKAIAALAVFAPGPMRAAMEEAALFAVSRRY
ncbi:MAG TPA: polyprenyl synthetase family protein [Novosphingobium sp.]|nr:polyprenyl synthetase family protein [Novosphingobium sp.]